MTTRLFLLSPAAPFERTAIDGRRPRHRALEGNGAANLLRRLTTKQLNNIRHPMIRDDADPAFQKWRAAHAPRDPIAQRLKTISFLNREIGKKIGETVGVNVTDMAAMELVLNSGSLTPGQLAERLKVTTAAATQIVDRLERAGHVARERKATDRRKIFVVPVEASVARVFEQLAPMLEGLDKVIANVAPTDRPVIEAFLDQVIDVYRTIAGLPPAPEPQEQDASSSSSRDDAPGVC